MNDLIASSNILNIYGAIQNERRRQEDLKRSGKFDFTCASLNVLTTAKLAVLAEEFGEVSKEVVEQLIETQKYAKENMVYPKNRKEYRKAELRKELVQVAAVCVAWLESLENDNE